MQGALPQVLRARLLPQARAGRPLVPPVPGALAADPDVLRPERPQQEGAQEGLELGRGHGRGPPRVQRRDERAEARGGGDGAGGGVGGGGGLWLGWRFVCCSIASN